MPYIQIKNIYKKITLYNIDRNYKSKIKYMKSIKLLLMRTLIQFVDKINRIKQIIRQLNTVVKISFSVVSD